MNTNVSPSIRERHKDAIKNMLCLKTEDTRSLLNPEPDWKLLIYDRTGQDILSPLLSVKELRDLGVTLHMHIHSDRDSIPDVPAIYFVLPSDENVHRICQDLRNSIYDQFYFHFITPISISKLENIANASLESNASDPIRKVYDQYCHFISLEDEMFILREHDRESVNYYSLNRSDVTDAEIESRIDGIVESLFSLLVTMGVVPIIRAPTGNAAEMIAEKLDKKLRENLRNTRSGLFNTVDLFSGSSLQLIFQRPLLVILDRNCDMATPLHHTWTYQALAHDLLSLRLNQIKLDQKPSQPPTQKHASPKIYDLSHSDKFWQDQKGNPFPQVAESVQVELESYRNSEEEVRKLKREMGLEGDVSDETISLISDTTQKLTSAVSSLPELLEKKRNIDMHTTIATSILEEIKNRKLDIYFEVEQKMLTKQVLDKTALMELILDPTAGTPQDKLRILLINLLCCHPELSDSEVNELTKSIVEAGFDDIQAVLFMKRWKSFSRMLVLSDVPSVLGGGTKTVNMFSKLMTRGSQFVMEGVKNFVVKKHNLPVTRMTDTLMEGRSSAETDDFRTYDPRLIKASSDSSTGTSAVGGALGGKQQRNPFQNAIVFVVGGGNYIEYQNLMDYCKLTRRCMQLDALNEYLEGLGRELLREINFFLRRIDPISVGMHHLYLLYEPMGQSEMRLTTANKTTPKRIIYGCTDLVTPNDFLSQLTKLGEQL